LKAHLKKYFISGLVVVVPISLTIYILSFIISFTDKLYPIVEAYLPFYVPGFGIIITFLIIFFVGVITTNFLGKKLISTGEKIIARIPLVKVIYHSIKQIAEAMLSFEEKSFRKVVLIEYPRKGIYSMAFVTGVTKNEAQAKTQKKLINVFLPTTPNPTSGFYLMVPEDELIELQIKPDEAFRLIVSGGMAS
jgi:uncharacterized membrane protein